MPNAIVIPVRDGEVAIDEELWTALNAQHSRREISEAIADTIVDGNLQMPMRKITRGDAVADMVALAGLDTSRLLREGEWFSRYEYAAHWWRRPLVIATVPTGGKSSDYFQQENRWKCDSINSPSPYRTWHTKQFLMTLLSALWSLKCTKVNNSVLRSCIGLRKYIASQFRPTAAKAIYDHFGAERVLDFSSGWGDRLVGFMASESRHYIGVDPSESAHEGYRSYLREFQRTDATTDLRHGTAETQMYEPNSVDLVFTSPPYFNIEHYDRSSSQSYRKHPKLDAWLEAFLFEAIRRAWGALRVGGTYGDKHFRCVF